MFLAFILDNRRKKMADLQDLNTIANDAAFRGRCREALTLAANNVMAEDINTSGHALRLAYAQIVLAGNQNDYSVALAVLANPTISVEATIQSLPGATSSIPDSDIQFTINSLFNALAGYGDQT
jgi:hypothetical protein